MGMAHKEVTLLHRHNKQLREELDRNRRLSEQSERRMILNLRKARQSYESMAELAQATMRELYEMANKPHPRNWHELPHTHKSRMKAYKAIEQAYARRTAELSEAYQKARIFAAIGLQEADSPASLAMLLKLEQGTIEELILDESKTDQQKGSTL